MDRREFIDCVERNQETVRRFLTALCCGDADKADDLAQDTFLKAYLACGTFRGDSKFTTWIFKIAHNTFLNSCRGMERTTGIDEARMVEGDDRSDRSFEYQDLYAALERLNEAERSTILLHYMQGYQIKEISEITSATVENVKQRLSRGRKHLKSLLEK